MILTPGSSCKNRSSCLFEENLCRGQGQLLRSDGMRGRSPDGMLNAPKYRRALRHKSKRRPAMKKVSTAPAKQLRKNSQQKLTVGLDLGDRNGWYCVPDEVGQIQVE